MFLINYPEPLAEFRSSIHRRLGAVIFGSDQGICGRFKEQLAQFVVQELNQPPAQRQEPLLLGMGARVCDVSKGLLGLLSN